MGIGHERLQYKLLLLDAGGVFLPDDNTIESYVSELLREHYAGKAHATRLKQYGELWSKKWRNAFWSGQMDIGDLARALGKFTRTNPVFIEKRLRGRRITVQPYAPWLADLQIRTAVLSNHRHEWLVPACVEARLNFDHIFVSSEIGAVKPDPKAWEIVLRYYGMAPEDVLFVDDQQRNIDVADRLGLATLHAKGDWIPLLCDLLREAEHGSRGHISRVAKHAPYTVGKVLEEAQELFDASMQGSQPLILEEIADLYGALQIFAEANGMSLDDVRRAAEAKRQRLEHPWMKRA
jgi:HAD superfamily hydrolase (TIGR01493 family)